MALTVQEMFQVTPSDTQLQIPPYAQAGPLRVLYNTGAEGLVKLAFPGKADSPIAYNMPAGSFLSGVGDIFAVLATGTTATDIRGAAWDDRTP